MHAREYVNAVLVSHGFSADLQVHADYLRVGLAWSRLFAREHT